MSDAGRPAQPRPTRCPLLASEGGRRGRCRASGQPERIGPTYQEQVCQAPAFLHCPRLAEAAAQALARAGRPVKARPAAAAPPPAPPSAGPEQSPGLPGGPAEPRVASPPPATGPAVAPGRRARSWLSLGPRPTPMTGGPGPVAVVPVAIPAERPARPQPGRQGHKRERKPRGAPAPRARPGRRPALAGAESWVAGRRVGAAVTARRPIALSELALLALGISILFAALSVVLALAYRAQVGPGMRAAPDAVAAGAEPRPTPRPTYTPTPAATTTPPASPTALSPWPAATEPAMPSPTPVPVQVRPPAGSPPTRLRIDKIGLDVPVLVVGTKTVRSGGTTRTVWADVPNAGGFHQTSAFPGWPGNTVINGHRDILGAVFRELDRLVPGDEIVLYVGDMIYAYQVIETKVVPEAFASAEQRAENLRLIGYIPEERLTLVTCTPVGLATHRLLVIARPADSAQMPEAGSTPAP